MSSAAGGGKSSESPFSRASSWWKSSTRTPGPADGRVCAAGRLLGLRDFGKLIFAPLRDRTGRLQTGLKKDALSEWWPRRKWLDGGDLVGVRGELGFTQKGEPTIWADEVHLLSKAVAPPPEKWHGMSDTEARYRRRYVDLWTNPDVLETFVARAKVLSTTRRFLEGEGYIEVETPTLHPIAGGAAARPRGREGAVRRGDDPARRELGRRRAAVDDDRGLGQVEAADLGAEEGTD